MTAIAGELSRRPHLDPGLAVWLLVMMFVLLCLALSTMAPWIVLYPSNWVLPIAPAVDSFSTAVAEFVKPAFRGIAWLFDWPMRGLQAALQWVPWPIMLILIGMIALRAGGRSLAAFYGNQTGIITYNRSGKPAGPNDERM